MKVLPLLLALVSMLVLIGLILKLDVWIVIVCYWALVVVKNATDCIYDDQNNFLGLAKCRFETKELIHYKNFSVNP